MFMGLRELRKASNAALVVVLVLSAPACGGAVAPDSRGTNADERDATAHTASSGSSSGDAPSASGAGGAGTSDTRASHGTSDAGEGNDGAEETSSPDASGGGGCEEGAIQCAGNTPQTCGPDGQWQSGTACSGGTAFCENGTCATDAPSCRTGGDGLTNCGSTGESCCASLEVTGGTYYRTYANSGDGPTGEADPATISGFRLDKYLVTVGRFRQFVAAWNKGYAPPAGSGKHTHLNGGLGLANAADPGTYEPGWDAADWNSGIAPTDANLTSGTYNTWTATAGSQEKLPINNANWYEAYAFCIWDGGFLPSEAEFEYAAAGGSRQREYPWGLHRPGDGEPLCHLRLQLPGIADPISQELRGDAGRVCDGGRGAVGSARSGRPAVGVEPRRVERDVRRSVHRLRVRRGLLPPARTLRGGDFGGDSTLYLAPYRTTAASNPSSEFDTPDTHSDGIGFRCARTP